jgi:hypothetical protein
VRVFTEQVLSVEDDRAKKAKKAKKTAKATKEDLKEKVVVVSQRLRIAASGSQPAAKRTLQSLKSKKSWVTAQGAPAQSETDRGHPGAGPSRHEEGRKIQRGGENHGDTDARQRGLSS